MFFFLKKYTVIFFKGSRVKTWPVSLTPSFMSGALAYKKGFFDGGLFFLTALSILFIQIAVNLFNDAIDGRQGLDHAEERLGPARLVGSKQASFFEVQALAFFSCFLACLFAAPLVLKAGTVIFVMGLFSLLACYFYTGSSYSFLKLGLSEFCAVLFFGFFIVFGVYYIQALNLLSELFYLGIQCGLWSVSFLLINHLRDEKTDRAKGRKHFVTLYGRENALFFVMAAQALIYSLCFYWINLYPKAGLFSFCVLPFSCFLLYQLCQNPPHRSTQVLVFAGISYVLFGAAWIFGLFF